MSSKGFPKDFLWGTATAAPQIEGGWNQDGRTPSIWDIAPKKKIKEGDTCHESCDHYNRYKEDVAILKELGMKSYRFSISWSRLIPEEGIVNPKGIQFYSDLVDELLKAGIEPLVTIYHWDLPIWVQKKGGWLSKKIIKLFADYTKVVVDALSDRVTYWMTLNEPQCFIMNGHMQGAHAPFKRRYLALSKMSRICMLSHGESVKIIRKYAKLNPKVGIAMASGAFVPKSESKEDLEEARRKSFDEGIGVMGNKWWCDPILSGKPVRAYGVYKSKQKDMAKINQKLDFVGINIYSPFNSAGWGGDKDNKTSGLPKNSIGWVVDGRGLYYAIKFMYERYNIPIMVTENGFCDNDLVSLDGQVHDPARTDYIMRYLAGAKRAINENIPVIGYQYWSFMDNFEWAEGYDPRFGLVFVDFNTKERIVKDSAREYAKIISNNGESI